MNKLGLLLLLLISSASCLKLREIPVDLVFELFSSFFKGMAKTEEAKCSNVMLNEKERIIKIINEAIDDYNNGKGLNVAIQVAVIKLVDSDELVDECNILAMEPVMGKITTKDGIVEIFQNIIDNMSDIYSYGEKLKAAFDEKNYNSMAESLGHIISLALNFNVY